VLHGSRRGDATFREILRGLTFGSDPEDLLQRIAERVARLVDASGAYIERADPTGDLIISSRMGRRPTASWNARSLPGICCRRCY